MKKMHISDIVSRIFEASSVKVNMKVYEMQRQHKDVIILSLGEAFFKLPNFSFKNIPHMERGYHYSSSLGTPELRKIIGEYYLKKYGVRADHNTEVLISAGSKILIYMTFQTLLNSGDEAIVLEPAWVSYTEQITLLGAFPKTVPYYEEIYDLEKYITKKTRLIVINNPNNPSGKVYSKKELTALYGFAQKHNLYVISDEAYSDFVSTEPFISMGTFDPRKERVIVVNSLSKNLGMSGWRIGYVIANKNLVHQMLKLNQHLVTCPATILEDYVAMYFKKIIAKTEPQIKAVVSKREDIQGYLKKIGLDFLPGTGAFYFMVSTGSSKMRSQEFAEKLLERYSVAVVPGIGYGVSLDAFVRVGVGTEPKERIKKALQLMAKFIKETS